MIPIDIDDISCGVALARDVYEMGFQKAGSTNPRYCEFGQDIRSLAINLDILSNVVQKATYDAGHTSGGTQHGSRRNRLSTVPGCSILSGFSETMDECQRLLNDQRYFQRAGRFVANITWFEQIEPEVQRIRDRISCHNIKLSVVFKIIDTQVLKDRAFYISDSTAILQREVEYLGQRFRGSEGVKLLQGKQLPGFVVVPQELEKSFMKFTQRMYPDLSILTLDRGIDAIASYFNKMASKNDQPTPSQGTYLGAIVDLMMASWILQAVRSTLEYETAARHLSTTSFERQMDTWGLTIDRFFDVLDESLQESLRLILGPDLLLPPTPDLLETFERDMPQLPAELESLSPIPTPTPSRRQDVHMVPAEYGVRVMSAQLRSSDPNYTQSLQVFNQTGKRSTLILLTTPLLEGRERETMDNYDLDHVETIPSYAQRTWTAPSLDPLSIKFKTDRAAPFYRTLVFQQNKDLFEFQEAMTGFRVKHDDVRVLATSQESKVFGGSRRQDLCRLQLWSAAPTNGNTHASSSSSPRSTSDGRRFSQTSLASSSTLAGQSRKKSSTPSLFSTASRKTTSSRKSIAIDTPSLSGLPGSSNIAGVINTPTLPSCVVLFAHKAPTLSARVEGSAIIRSFMVINITAEDSVAEELSESENEANVSFRCVLERKSSYLQARRSHETTDPDLWDLTAVGQHKREKETEIVKKLKHVILEFDSRQNLMDFMTKFKQIKEIADWRLAKLLQGTG